jgi:hypothetical protein
MGQLGLKSASPNVNVTWARAEYRAASACSRGVSSNSPYRKSGNLYFGPNRSGPFPHVPGSVMYLELEANDQN